MKINIELTVFIGSTIKSLKDEREAVYGLVRGMSLNVRELFGEWRLDDYTIKTIPTGASQRSVLREAIMASGLFIGIYAPQMPMDPSLLWDEELQIALDCKPDEKILLFRQHPEMKNRKDHEVWQKIAARGLFIKRFRRQEDLLLYVHNAVNTVMTNVVSNLVMTQIVSSMPQLSEESILSSVFDLGHQPYWFVYGRRSSKPRKEYGSLQTFRKYSTTYHQLHNQFPEIAVEPDVDEMIFEQNDVILLSGPPTSNWSKEYFARLRELGIHLFSGSCRNHLGEICSQIGGHCKPERDKNATGCAYVDDEEPVYAFRDYRPATHVAMLVRTPSPWVNLSLHGNKEEVPSIIFAAGCHSRSGLLACNCITSENFMRKLLADIDWTPESTEPPWFVALISQIADQDPVVEYVGRIQIRNEDEWVVLPPRPVPETREIRILHLSDIHLGSNDKVELYLSQLTADLKQQLKINKLDYIVISGDIADYSTSEEYEAAFNLISGLFNNFDLDSSRLLVVPGNHDLNWELSKQGYLSKHKDKLPEPLLEGRYIPVDDVDALVCDKVKYKKRFNNFNDYFYKKIYGRNYPLDYANQGILYPQPQDQILFLGLNSCWEIDHHFRKRASIHSSALSRALDEAIKPQYQDWLKIAVWHHSISGQEAMNSQFIERLVVAGFRIGMHGHVHEAKDTYTMYDIERGIHIIGSGTFGAPAKDQVVGIPLQYNLLTFDQENRTITIETRKKEKPEGAWSADARWGDKNNPSPRYTVDLNRKG